MRVDAEREPSEIADEILTRAGRRLAWTVVEDDSG
jgi:hypothetical protein